MSGKEKIVAYLFLSFVTIFTITLGTVFLINNQKDTKGFTKVDAVVVGYESKEDYNSDRRLLTYYSETVEYVVDGKKYTAQNEVWSSSPKKIGEKIKIAYDPSSPSTCVFFDSKNIFTWGLYLIGGVTFIILLSQIVGDIKQRIAYD